MGGATPCHTTTVFTTISVTAFCISILNIYFLANGLPWTILMQARKSAEKQYPKGLQYAWADSNAEATPSF